CWCMRPCIRRATNTRPTSATRWRWKRWKSSCSAPSACAIPIEATTVKTYRIACIPGDGIGKEVIPAGQEVLQALAASGAGFNFEFESFGSVVACYREHGKMMPDDGLEALRDKDAILFGSAGDPHIPDHITLWG